MTLDLPDLSGRTYLITGSTSGIGRDAARRLGARGATVLVHGRDADAGRAVVREATDAGGDAVAVNHLAPFLLTQELAGHLADGARIVTTSSEAHRSGSVDTDSIHRPSGLSGWSAYADSKLANVLFTRELARRLPDGYTANCVHPGVIPGSGFARGVPFPLSLGWKAIRFVPGMADTVEDGGRALARLAASPEVTDRSGVYFEGTRRTRPVPAARDGRTARRLWETSADPVGVDPDLPFERTPAEDR